MCLAPLTGFVGHESGLVGQSLTHRLIGQVAGKYGFKNVSEAIFVGHIGFSF